MISSATRRELPLRNVGLINPESIEEYIARDGYFALGKVLNEMTPEEGYPGDHGIGSPGPRRGGLPDRFEMGVYAESRRRGRAHGEICGLQRR